MNETEIRRIVVDEVKKQANVILQGASANATGQSEDITDLFPGMPAITGRPTMQPFGFVSRATAGVISVVARVGSHFGNRMTLGHRDGNSPLKAIKDGESCIYSSGGYRLVVQNGQIMIGKGADLEPAVVGTTLQSFLSALVDELAKHTHASPGAPPTDAAVFEELKTNYLDNGKILAEDGGRF